MHKFGKLSAIDKGHYGKVYSGRLKNAVDICVLRVDKSQFKVDEDILWKAHLHPNIAHFYGMEEDDEFLYIATELCYCTLKESFRRNDNHQQLQLTDKELLCQIGSALEFLHEKAICHRDLKPSSILISRPNGTLRQHVKLTHFAYTRASYSIGVLPLHKLVESKGWLPPEIYNQEEACFTIAMDVFSLGLVFAYVLSGGIHAFGSDKESRVFNLKKKLPMTITIQNLKDVVGAEKMFDLIKMMLSYNHEERPSVTAVLNKLETYQSTAAATAAKEATDQQLHEPPQPFQNERDIADNVTDEGYDHVEQNNYTNDTIIIGSTQSATNVTTVEDSSPALMESFIRLPNGDPLPKRMRLEEEHPLSYPSSPTLPQPTINQDLSERSFSRSSTASSDTQRLFSRPEPGQLSFSSSPQEQRRPVGPSTPPSLYDVQAFTAPIPPPAPFIGDISQLNPYGLISESDDLRSIQQFIPTDMENDVQSWSSESSVIETFNIPPPPLPPRYSDGAQLDNNFQRPKQEEEFRHLCAKENLNESELARLHQLIEDETVDINYRNKSNAPIVLLCQFYRGPNIYLTLKLFLKRKDLDIHSCSPSGYNALMFLCRFYYHNDLYDCVQLLVEAGLDPEIKEKGGHNALRLLCLNYTRKNLLDIALYLLYNSTNLEDVAKCPNYLWKRNFHEEANYFTKIYKKLLDGSDPKELELMELCSRSYLEERNGERLCQLVSNDNLNVNVIDENTGRTPFLTLCYNNQNDSLCRHAQYLLRRNKNIDINAKGNDGLDALSTVCFKYGGKRLFQIVELLINRGIDINNSSLYVPNALFALVTNQRRFSYKSDSNLYQIVKALVDAGVDPNQTNNDGLNVLFLLIKNYHWHADFGKIVSFLVGKGLNVNVRNLVGKHLFLILCEKFHENQDLFHIFKLLIDCGMDVSVQDDKGSSGVDILRTFGLEDDSKVIQLLLHARQ